MTTKQGTSAKKTAKKSVKKVSKQTTKAPAKKTAKKAVAKKTTPKKSSPKKVAKKTGAKTTKSSGKKLVTAKGANCFWVHEGPILKDLRELEAALEAMSEAMFTHHVSKERNDFADWVEHTLKDAAAAADMRKAKKPHTARKVVVRHLKLYRLPN